MHYEIIEAHYAIGKAISEDGYIVAITESKHPMMGLSYHFEMEQMVGSYFSKIDEICKRYDVTFSVTGKGNHALLTISEA